MNEKLKREHHDWICANASAAGFIDTTKLAEHFYNPALKDVKKEIESKLDVPNRKVKWREKHELEPDYNVRVCVLLKDIIDFIEKQEV